VVIPREFQVRFHGRGGQGVVTAAELLSVAAFVEGRFSQAFPSFGSERAGAPVTAFCRISNSEIRTRAPVTAPDALVVQDATLLRDAELTDGLRPDGYLLVNSPRTVEELPMPAHLGALPRGHLVTVPATEVALRHLGRPVPNAVLLGGLAALCGVVALEAVTSAIGERFRGPLAEANGAAATEAFNLVSKMAPRGGDVVPRLVVPRVEEPVDAQAD
jgi:pyruvate ferredoxin oxidoreductase gamma subunit